MQFFAYLLLVADIDSTIVIDIFLSFTTILSVCLAIVIMSWDVRRESVAVADVKRYATSKLHEIKSAIRERRSSASGERGSMSTPTSERTSERRSSPRDSYSTTD